MAFSELWTTVQRGRHRGQRVRNSPGANGFLGNDSTVVRIDTSNVWIDAPNTETVQRVSRKEFKVMLDHWTGYCSGQVKRSDLIKLARVSKYTMSILRHLDVQAPARSG